MELKTDILEKLSVRQPFFYLPNQFWKHKNHRIVFEALSILKRTGKNPCVVCSGRLSDYRNQGHIDQLKDFIRSNELNVKLLGLIPFEAVAVLMRNSLAVINPSLFEGWSTTVEECKSLGKRLILSDIPVHREQDPLNCIYFDPKDPHELAQIIEREMNSPSVECESVDLDFRTRSFAEQYQSIVFEALGIKHLHLTVGTNHHSDVKTQ
jgi:glycosyltransferase involved in cell wall biosynthesis